MKILATALTAFALLIAPLTNAALAGNKSIVTPFYDYLSNPSSDSHAQAFKAAVTDNWESIGDYSGKIKTRDQFVAQLGGFGKLIPDMNWNMEEVIEAGDRVIVRGRATGTPNGPFFGVDGKGKGFDILSIDIHTIKDGKIVRTYHVEDWAGALRQLSAK